MKVFVIGGGIGGLTTALSLQKEGIDVTLYEAADRLSAKGAGIWMSPNSIKVMEYLGIAGKFLKTGIEMQFATIENRKGEEITVVPMAEIKKRHRYAIHSVTRQSLHDLLANEIHPESIISGRRVESVRQNGSQIDVFFADGNRDTCEVLIGADGIRSVVRESVNPGVVLRYSGQTCWYGLSSAKLPEDRKNKTTEIWMGKYRFGFTDVNEGQVYFFAVEKSLPGIQFNGDKSLHLQQLFADAPDVVLDILKNTRSEDIYKGDLSDIKPSIPLVYGRIALIGDAGHATTPNLGQGAAQAMEDGVLIAELLSKMAPEIALHQFESMRKKRITHIVKTSWSLGQIAHGEGFLRGTLLQGIMKRIPYAVSRRMMDVVLTPVFP